MAQRVNVVLIDDLDPEQEAQETISFAFEGMSYEVDLSDVHAKELRELMAVYTAAGRRIGGRTKKSSSAKASTSTKAQNDGASAAEVRSWAAEHGFPDLPKRGRIPSEVREAYDKAHGNAS